MAMRFVRGGSAIVLPLVCRRWIAFRETKAGGGGGGEEVPSGATTNGGKSA